MKTLTDQKVQALKFRNSVIFQHNNLIAANYKLSLQEKRIILWLISQIRPDDEKFKLHSIKASEFCEILEIEKNYSYLRKVVKKLQSKTLNIQQLEEKSITTINWLSCAKYCLQEGKIELSFEPLMKNFLLQLKKNFTALKFSDLIELKSIYAIRIYELLKQYKNFQNERVFELEDLRKQCGIEDSKLTQYIHFKQKVLDIAQKEINEKSDICIQYETIKTGRKITAIKFFIANQNKKKHIGLLLQQKFGISKSGTTKLTQKHTDEEILNAISAVEKYSKKHAIKNSRAIIIRAIREQWHPNIPLHAIRAKQLLALKDAELEDMPSWCVESYKKNDEYYDEQEYDEQEYEYYCENEDDLNFL